MHERVSTLGVSASISKLNQLCVQPCFELKYDVQMSSRLLSLQNFKQARFVNKNLSYDEFLKNYAFVDFQLETSAVLYEDYQTFTLQDLFLYMGNNVGLYLGVSFMSAFEVLNLTLDMGVTFMKNSNNIIGREKQKLNDFEGKLKLSH